jgi:hypothetical protein
MFAAFTTETALNSEFSKLVSLSLVQTLLQASVDSSIEAPMFSRGSTRAASELFRRGAMNP